MKNTTENIKNAMHLFEKVYGFWYNPITAIARKNISKYLMNNYSKTIKIYSDANSINIIYNILSEYNPNIKKHYNSTEYINKIINSEFGIYLGNCTAAYLKIGSSIKFAAEMNMPNWALEITIFGKDYMKIVNRINSAFETISTVAQFEIRGVATDSDTYGVGYHATYSNNMIERRLDTLFYNDDEVDKVISHIDSHLKRREIFTKRGLIYKTGLILEGEPGTGKTSLVRALTTKYKASLVCLDVSTLVTTDLVNVAKAINADENHSMYIVLLEDIECIIDGLNRENKDIKKEESDIVNKLLQFLDGTSSPTNTIFIATTNHYEKFKNSSERLDKALLRVGRFDKICHIGGINEDKAREMCSSFDLNDSDIDKVLENEKFPINQSHLQGKILELAKIG